jgi:hypothetical protein
MFTLGLGALAMLKLELRRTLERAPRRGLLSAETEGTTRLRRGVARAWAGVAQLVEHLICNQWVNVSSPFASSKL